MIVKNKFGTGLGNVSIYVLTRIVMQTETIIYHVYNTVQSVPDNLHNINNQLMVQPQ